MLEKLTESFKARIMWRSKFGELLSKLYDFAIFSQYRFAENELKSKENYEAFITKQYHIIEKGMALPVPRKGFGKEKILVLMRVVESYEKEYHTDKLSAYVRAVLTKYLQRNETSLDVSFLTHLKNFIGTDIPPRFEAGTKSITMESIAKATDFDYENFVATRTSVRNFSEEEVDLESIKKAFEMARHTPSVCNRQSWKAYLFTGEKKDVLLRLQGGNQGFSESINKVIVLTTDIRKFTKMESNQVYVDGGLFAMNVILALHHQKIASCSLNLCKPYTDERTIAKVAGIAEYERLIMMIGLGNYRDNFEVATSPKKMVEDLLIVK